MAKKKRKPKKKAPRKRQSPPDWRALESLFAGSSGVFSEFLGSDEMTPLDQAQDLVYAAFDEPDPKRREALAREALEISPDCADAYVLLAENESSPTRALELYQQAVAAGERAIGREHFQELEGHFWGVLETRPYMRARHELANCLWTLGRRDEAIEHYQEMLRLNPNDNQGVRYVLAPCLLEMGRDEEAKQLLEQYPDDGAADWAYAKALLAFRREGDSKTSRERLLEARDANPHVPKYLVGDERIPPSLPPFIEPGRESEAIHCAVGSMAAWKAAPGALTWLRKTLKTPPPQSQERAPKPKQSGPVKEDFAELPQEAGELWQVDVRRFSEELHVGGHALRPWALVVFDATNGAVLTAQMSDERPSEQYVLEEVLTCMLEPAVGEPRRPGAIEFRLKTLQKRVQKRLKEIGVECRHRARLPQVDAVVAQAVEQYGAPAESAKKADPAELPQEPGDIWQVDIGRISSWVEHEGELVRPWCLLVVSRTSGAIIGQALEVEAPTSDWVLENLDLAIRQPSLGEPHRPGVVEVRSEEHRDVLQPFLAPLDVRCVAADALDMWDEAFTMLSEHLADSDSPAAMVDAPGVSLEQVGSFFGAAADFYRSAPWRRVAGDTPIKIACKKFTSGPWWGVVMGQSGMEQGLALYEDWDYLQALLNRRFSDHEAARRNSGISVTFDEPFVLSPRDLDAAETQGWPVAGPEAYPIALRINPGMAVRPPLAWELELLEGCLRAIPEFLSQGRDEATLSVPVASGSLELSLSLEEL